MRPKLKEDEYWKLRILIHTHDSFRGEAQIGVPVMHPMSHASLARDFLAKYGDDTDLLATVQYHDEPFALYRQFETRRTYNADRCSTLIASIHDWNLFLAFNIIDGCTAGKSRFPVEWLFADVSGKVESNLRASDIIV